MKRGEKSTTKREAQNEDSKFNRNNGDLRHDSEAIYNVILKYLKRTGRNGNNQFPAQKNNEATE